MMRKLLLHGFALAVIAAIPAGGVLLAVEGLV